MNQNEQGSAREAEADPSALVLLSAAKLERQAVFKLNLDKDNTATILSSEALAATFTATPPRSKTASSSRSSSGDANSQSSCGSTDDKIAYRNILLIYCVYIL
jgi:hypothetical protein